MTKGLIESDPVSFAYAVTANSGIKAGDILILADGTYTGDFICGWAGTADNPIIIKPKNPGKVVIDGNFTATSHIHVYDIDFTDTRPNRLNNFYGTSDGIFATGEGNHFHGCSIQQQRGSGMNWMGSEGASAGEISECAILLNGVRYEDHSGHGHGIYTHNNLGGRRLFARNAMYLNLGEYTLQMYSATNKTDDYSIIDNIFMGAVFCGGHFGPNNLIYQKNINYKYPAYVAFGMGTHTCNGILIDQNTIFGDSYTLVVGGDPGVLTNLVETDNVVYGSLATGRAGYTDTAKPATWSKYTPFTRSARWVGSLAIYNRDSAATVAVDLTGLLDAGSYLWRNTQNLAETWALEYTTGSIDVPTNFTRGAFIGDDYAPDTTWPIFGSFMVELAQ